MSQSDLSLPQHLRFQIDEAIHQPVRLSILSLLAHTERVEFGFLRDYVQVKDANLSLHLNALEALGYVAIEKGYIGKRPRTWVTMTPHGREAFTAYVQVLQQIVNQPADAGPTEGSSS